MSYEIRAAHEAPGGVDVIAVPAGTASSATSRLFELTTDERRVTLLVHAATYRPGGLSGAWRTANPDFTMVAAESSAFLVPVNAPQEAVQIPGSWLGVVEAVDDALLVLYDELILCAVGAAGVVWRVSVAEDGIDALRVEHGALRGVAHGPAERPRPFSIDLRTGAVNGGFPARPAPSGRAPANPVKVNIV